MAPALHGKSMAGSFASLPALFFFIVGRNAKAGKLAFFPALVPISFGAFEASVLHPPYAFRVGLRGCAGLFPFLHNA